jgi:hypothetical protein
MAILYDTGKRAILEFKPDWSHRADLLYARKLKLAEAVLREREWNFSTMVRFHFDSGSAGPYH